MPRTRLSEARPGDGLKAAEMLAKHLSESMCKVSK